MEQLNGIERSIHEFLKTNPNKSFDELHSNLRRDKRLIRKAMGNLEREGILTSFLRWNPKIKEAENIYSIRTEV